MYMKNYVENIKIQMKINFTFIVPTSMFPIVVLIVLFYYYMIHGRHRI